MRNGSQSYRGEWSLQGYYLCNGESNRNLTHEKQCFIGVYVILGLHGDNGKEHGNYYSGFGVWGFDHVWAKGTCRGGGSRV